MKYIRAQNGVVLSVSQLLPPAKGERHGHEIWRLNVITVDGQRHTYAIYTQMEQAMYVFSTWMVTRFICSDRPSVTFGLGEESLPKFEDSSSIEWGPDPDTGGENLDESA